MVQLGKRPGPSAETSRADDAHYGLTSQLVSEVKAAIEQTASDSLRQLIAPIHVADQADLIERLRGDERRTLIEALRETFDPEVLTYCHETVRNKIVEQLNPDEIVAAVVDMETDDAVTLIEDLRAPQQRKVLDALPVKDRLEVEAGLLYPDDSAGRLMQHELVSVAAYWTVGQTIDYMRETEDLPETFYEIFVVDPKHEPLGTVVLSRMLREKRPVVIGDIMETDLKSIPATMDQEEVAYVFDQYDLVSAPVVNEEGRLIGVITVDDVVDVIQEEAEEDIMRLGGVAETDLYRAAFHTARGRTTWLLVNLATAILASFVIYQFDATIDQIVALAVLMPIVASMGGNAGTQTMTVAVRALATKELTTTNALRVLGKELIVGGFNGIVFALLIGLIAGFWYNDIPLGGVIAAAMVVNMLVAGVAGMVIPLALSRLNIDPAAAAGVLLTTVTDVVGFFAFLGLAALFLL
jgi:magnesium transporter